MSARKLPLAALASLCALAGGLAFAGPALAVREYVPGVSFGAPCEEEPCGTGRFKEATGVAVNDSSEPLVQPAAGDVYVIDRGNNRVERFGSTGEYKGQFDGSGEFEVEGKKEKGAAAPTGQFAQPGGIAVDNSGKTALEDPSVGDVYVADVGHGVIDRFSATGEYLGQLEETTGGSSFGELYGVAVDPAGDLWVYEGKSE